MSKVFVIPIEGANVSIMHSYFTFVSLLSTPSGRIFQSKFRNPLWIILGRNATDSSGKCSLRINDYLRGPIPERELSFTLSGSCILDNNPRFIASSESEIPVILTSKKTVTEIDRSFCNYHDLITDEILTPKPKEYDVWIEVKSWKPDGSVAPRTVFSWVCIASGAFAEEYDMPV